MSDSGIDSAKQVSKQRSLVKLSGGDMGMYAAIAGKTPQIDPKAGNFLVEVAETRPAHAWSPIVLSLYLRDIARQGAMKLNKPEIAAWIKRQSNSAVKRFHESQHRITTARNDRAA